MRSRRKTLPVEFVLSGMEISRSQVGTPWRQMTITESFKRSKPKLFRMEKPFFVTNVCHEIDSDSDPDTPPQIKYEEADATTNVENHSDNPGRTMEAPSPPKIPKMIGVYRPGSSSPKVSPKKIISPATPRRLGIDLQSSLNTASPHSIGSNSSGKTVRYEYSDSIGWDEDTVPFPRNSEYAQAKKNDNEEVLVMNFEEEEDASEAILSPIQDNGENSLNIAIHANARIFSAVKRLDFTNSTDNLNAPAKKERIKRAPKKNTPTDSVQPNKNSDYTNNAKNPPKKPRGRKRKNETESNNNEQKNNSNSRDQNLSAPDKAVIKNVHSAKGRKRKNKTELNSDNQKSSSTFQERSLAHQNLSTTEKVVAKGIPFAKGRKLKNLSEVNDKKNDSTVKENSSPDQTLTNSIKKPIVTNVQSVTLVPRLRLSANQAGSIEQKSSVQNNSTPKSTKSPCRDMVTAPAGKSDKLFKIAAQTIRKGSSINVIKKTEKLTGIIDKLRTNKELSVHLVEIERNGVSNPQNLHHHNIDSSVGNATASVLPPSGWTSKATINSNPDTPTGNPPKKTLVDQRPVCSKSLVKENSYATLGKHGVEKNQQKDTPSKTVVDEQRPGCSKSLMKENSYATLRIQNQNGVEKNQEKDTPSKTVVDEERPSCSKSLAKENSYTTPKKQKMGPNTPSKNTSPKRKLFQSSNQCSPTKNREIKTLKSKEGKQLQVKQMDELVELFHMVDANRHLKTLLNSQEREILRKFRETEDNKKYFLMKLFVWKRKWYNIFLFCNKAKIEYKDEKDIIDIFEYLRTEELVDTEYTSSANLLELLNTLDLATVKEIMVERRIKPIKSKAENIKTILAAAGRQTTLTSKSFKDLIMESIQKKMGFAIKIKEDVSNAFYNAYLLATFTNPAFYKVEDYFRDIVHLRVVFPETHIELYPVFHTTDKFLRYGRALKLRTELDEQLTNKNKESKYMGIDNIAAEAYDQLLSLDTDDTDDYSEAPHLKKFTAQHIYTGILSACCEKMYTKQNGKPSEVKKWLEYLIERFPNSRRLAKWCELLIVLHMRHLNRINYEAGAKILIGLLHSKNPVVGDIAKHDLGKLGRQLKSSRTYKIDQLYHDRITELIPRSIADQNFSQVQIASQCIRSNESGRKRRYISKSIEGMTVRGVEQVALEHYADNGYPGGEHCEGSLIKALLMLFFWDIIYNPTKNIPGTFLSKLQVGPLDMWTSHFYQNRMELIDERLEEIDSKWSDDKLVEFAANNWQQHAHERAAFSLDVIADQPTVEVLINVIGRKVLAKIFERLIKNLRAFSSGMPDLLVWNIDKKQCKFVEVKGENDRLSTNQKLWLQYLEQSGAVIEVCHVHSTGSKLKKLKKKVNVEEEAEVDNEVGRTERPEDQ